MLITDSQLIDFKKLFEKVFEKFGNFEDFSKWEMKTNRTSSGKNVPLQRCFFG
jgi:hypothetical protein